MALSSGEAELHGIATGATYAIGTQDLLRDLGVEVKVRMRTDASAAIGMVKRRGVGKVRRIEVKELWIQDQAHLGEVDIRTVRSQENLADVLLVQARRLYERSLQASTQKERLGLKIRALASYPLGTQP